MAKKYLKLEGGNFKEEEALTTSVGAGSAGKIPALDNTGRFSETMMPAGIGADAKVIVASEGLSAGDLVNVFYDTNKLKARKADASTNKPADGFAKEAVSKDALATIYFDGTNTNLTGLTPGVTYFLSASTPGGISVTPPTGAGKIVQKIGKSLSKTELTFEAQDSVTLA